MTIVTTTGESWGYGLDAGTFAMDIMNFVRGFAEEAASNAESIATVFDDLDEISPIYLPNQITNDIDFNRAREVIDYMLLNMPEDPTLIPVDVTVPDLGELETLPALPPIDIDNFTGTSPNLTFPDVPDWETYTPPVSDDVVYPAAVDRPDISYPSSPNISDINVPDPPAIEIPSFDETLTPEELTIPTNTFDFNEEDYSSVLLDAVTSGLLDEIQNGGYGLEPNDETDLFERGRDREIIAGQTAIDEVTRTFSLSGFPMPTGALQKAVARARQEATDKVSTMNRELTLKRSELYWEGKKFTHEKAIQIEEVLIGLHNAVYERALNAAKVQVQVAIDIFNASVAKFNANNERFIALANVYKTQIEAEVAKVELYKGQVEGARIRSELNKNIIDLYLAQLQGTKLVIDVYSADVAAYKAVSEVERLKVEIFRAEVEAFVGQVQAKKSEFDAYASAVQGQVARVDAYKSEAQAYSAYVDGKRGHIEAIKLNLTSFIEKNRSLIEQYKAESDTYNQLRQAQIVYNQAEIEAYKGKVTAFDAEMTALIKAYDLNINAEEAEFKTAALVAQVNTENVKTELERVVQIARLKMDANKNKADIYRSLAASSLASLNANASLSGSTSESFSEAYSRSASASTVASKSDSTVRQVSTSSSTSASAITQSSSSTSVQASTSAISQAVASASNTANDNHNHKIEGGQPSEPAPE